MKPGREFSWWGERRRGVDRRMLCSCATSVLVFLASLCIVAAVWALSYHRAEARALDRAFSGALIESSAGVAPLSCESARSCMSGMCRAEWERPNASVALQPPPGGCRGRGTMSWERPMTDALDAGPLAPSALTLGALSLFVHLLAVSCHASCAAGSLSVVVALSGEEGVSRCSNVATAVAMAGEAASCLLASLPNVGEDFGTMAPVVVAQLLMCVAFACHVTASAVRARRGGGCAASNA